jgi:predicted nucleic acid-binding protein
MRVFVDTSAFLAILTENDSNYQAAKQVWHDLIRQDATLVCTN